MSFRKRNLGLTSGLDRARSDNPALLPQDPSALQQSGIRPSPDDGRPTTSTGCRSLDSLLAGHSGLPMGKILLIEENGTTDFAGTLLRYYAAEGVVQDQKVYVVGMSEHWGRSLPGLIGSADATDEKEGNHRDERMKIAWRYERLGEFGAGIAGSRGAPKTAQAHADASASQNLPTFCHAFDLTKRLTHPSLSSIVFVPLGSLRDFPFLPVFNRLQSEIAASAPNSMHRIVIPSLLNPTTFPPEASQPQFVLQFLHSLRALLDIYSTRVTAMITLPLFLFPRPSGLVRWMEIICDGVIELCPFPHSSDALAASGAATSKEEPPQGMLKTHKLPVLHERGGGSDQNVGQDWAFVLSRKKFEIKPFSLPPAEGDKEAQDAANASQMPRKVDLEF